MSSVALIFSYILLLVSCCLSVLERWLVSSLFPSMFTGSYRVFVVMFTLQASVPPYNFS